MNSDSDKPEPASRAIAPIMEEAKAKPKKRALGDIFARAFEIYRDNPIMIVPSLFPIAVLLMGMVIFVGYVGMIAVFAKEAFIAFSVLAGIFLFMIIMIVLFFLAEGVTIEIIREASSGNKVDLSRAWQVSKTKIEPLILSSLLAGVIAACGYVLFFIPGVILSFAFYFVAQTVMIDGKSGVEALKASYGFVEANLSDALIIVLASLVIGAVLPAIPFIGPLLSLIVLPYIYGLATLLYLDYREVQREMPEMSVQVS